MEIIKTDNKTERTSIKEHPDYKKTRRRLIRNTVIFTVGGLMLASAAINSCNEIAKLEQRKREQYKQRIERETQNTIFVKYLLRKN